MTQFGAYIHLESIVGRTKKSMRQPLRVRVFYVTLFCTALFARLSLMMLEGKRTRAYTRMHNRVFTNEELSAP